MTWHELAFIAAAIAGWLFAINRESKVELVKIDLDYEQNLRKILESSRDRERRSADRWRKLARDHLELAQSNLTIAKRTHAEFVAALDRIRVLEAPFGKPSSAKSDSKPN